jgi:two-component system, OmpR family, alkaline phosphatase synthesis response regulator PhoP
MAPRILIADDEKFVTLLYRDMLLRAGFEVLVANDGVEALEMIRKEKPDLVLLDLVMPRLDGFRVLQAMKADGALQSIPVAVLSNLSQDNDEEKARALGAADYIVKVKLGPKELPERLQKLLA